MNKHITSSTDNNALSIVPTVDESFHMQLFCYEIAHNRIFIEPKIKIEVLEKTVIYPIPHAPKWYTGVTSLRGNILTVVNMHFLLGIEEKNTVKRLLRLEHPDFPPLAIAIDNLPHQRGTKELEKKNQLNKSHYPQWIKSTSKHHNSTFLFADHSALFEAMQNNAIGQPVITTVSLPTKD